MFEVLWLIPALPFICFFLLILLGTKLTHGTQAVTGVGMIGLSAATATIVALKFIISPPAGFVYVEKLWTWVQIGQFSPIVAFYLDPLSVIMILLVTWVSFFVLLYSTYSMAEDEGFRRFFAYMNLFVGFMLVLVLADNFLLLYFGWEGVGLCSYLLIGFWYKKEENARAAFKAFIVTRIGDAALVVGLFLIFYNLGTLNIREALTQASERWVAGSLLVNTAAALLLGGALGKSAQLPLQTWLPDAMVGPTPVSALIHAATMVTAGVYLIARTHLFFAMAPSIQYIVAIIGAITLLVGASTALVQRDIKRILAYSTMSQIGYMFLALGAGAWVAAIFHLMIHAFFKALLFLCAGVIIEAFHNEHDIFNMGGMKKELPLVFWTFLVGCASLSAVPLVSGGFYSKDLILLHVWASPQGGLHLFLAGLIGSVITSIYSFRLLFLVFYGEVKGPVIKTRNQATAISLVVLAVLAVIGGYVETPRSLGEVTLFSNFMKNGLPEVVPLVAEMNKPGILLILSSIASLGGIYVAYLLFLKKPEYGMFLIRTTIGRSLHRFLFSGWGFDRAYDTLVVQPFVYLTRLNRNDLFNLLYKSIELLCGKTHDLLRKTQTGNLRWYVTAIVFGAVMLMGLVIFL